MKIFDIQSLMTAKGEAIIGSQATGSHACYLMYGVLKPGEKGRELKPGQGHEEIVLCLQGEMKLTGHHAGGLKQGKAIHLRGEETCAAENPLGTETIYVISGGHSGEGH